MISKSAISVSQLNTYVKMMFDADNLLHKVTVIGEISNFVNHYKTGHLYFTLKDNSAAIKAVMFASSAKSLKFIPENGMRVYLTGRVSVFERDGVYQIYADSMEPEGAGSLMIAFEQLKNKLASQGLFDENNKKQLPQYPQKIAVVTSPVGAAVQDVINVLSRRYPLAEIVFYPVAAQGINCAKENIDAIKLINDNLASDVIILCRGGGSIEDLWGYNDEQLVRTVAASKIPIITGIGHETDFTLCDFASDYRAPTPSAAAEISVPDIYEIKQLTDLLIYRLDKALQVILNLKDTEFQSLNNRIQVHNPNRIIELRTEQLAYLCERLKLSMDNYITLRYNKIRLLSEQLRLLNPLSMLKNGYLPVYKNNDRVKSVSALTTGDNIEIDFSDGRVLCEVINTKLTENNYE